MDVRVFIASDLHLRIAAAREGVNLFSDVEADVAVVARDMCDGLAGVAWLGRTLARRMDVVCALGNHDLYGEDMTVGYERAAEIAAGHDRLHLLQDCAVVIGGVRFVGSTLWTDYKLFEGVGGASAAECMRIARRELADYGEIYPAGAVDGRMGHLLTARDTVGHHERLVRYLESVFEEEFDGQTVVVSHHAVSRRSISERFADNMTSAAFASNLDGLVERSGAALWVHGHVHHSCDYEIGGTRVCCNARGYESAGYDKRLVVEL
jgi:Icc-related predicted phosphoesterase